MDQIYHYILTTNDPDAPMPEELNGPYRFQIEGGEDNPISKNIPTFTTTLPQDGRTYEYLYNAVVTDVQKDRYALELAPKTIKVAIDTTKTGEEAVTVQYTYTDTCFNPADDDWDLGVLPVEDVCIYYGCAFQAGEFAAGRVTVL